MKRFLSGKICFEFDKSKDLLFNEKNIRHKMKII